MSEIDEGIAGRTRIEELAYQQGRRDADVDARLLGHERRLNAINGSIERHARNADKLARTVDERCDSLEKQIKDIAAILGARAAVEADRAEQEAKHDQEASRGLTRLQRWALIFGVPTGIAVPILSSFIAAGKLF